MLGRPLAGARWWVFAAVLGQGILLSLAGCDLSSSSDPGPAPHDNPGTIRDVTGVEFGWHCGATAREGCSLLPLATTRAPDPCEPAQAGGYSFAWGRFFEICSICIPDGGGAWSTTAGRCRVVVCAADSDCPVIPDTPPAVFNCRNGLCQNVDTSMFPPGSLKRFEAEDLCFAVHERGETTSPATAASLQVQADLDAACMGTSILATCSLPPACRIP